MTSAKTLPTKEFLAGPLMNCFNVQVLVGETYINSTKSMIRQCAKYNNPKTISFKYGTLGEEKEAKKNIVNQLYITSIN